MNTSNKCNVLVIGAGRYTGIGADICRRIASNGMNVVFTSCVDYDKKFINQTNYDLLLDEIRQYNVVADWTNFDVRDQCNINYVFDFAEGIFKSSVDVLVYCACYYVDDSLDDLSYEIINNNYEVNSKAPFMLCQEFYKRFHGTSGRIILISSTQNLEPLTQSIAYGITKSTVPGIVYTLFPILGRKNITINAVNPGPTRVGYNYETTNIPKSNLTFDRIGETEDVVNLVEFLISTKGKWITGQTINSEGGLIRNSN